MKCERCGADIPEGMLYCPKCGKEVRIVPDYSPLDDVLEKQVRGSINNTTTPLDSYDIDEEYRRQATSTPRRRRTDPVRQSKSGGSSGQKTNPAKRKQAALRRKKAKQKKRIRLLVLFLLLIAVLVGGIFLLYRNSYTGLVKRGDACYVTKDYNKALELYQKAMDKDKTREAAYIGYYKVYLAEGDTDTPEQMLLKTVGEQPKNADMYEAVCRFYMDSEQETKISPFLADCEDNDILKKLSKYRSEKPAFSLDEGSYDDVQQVSLTSKGTAIYYTVDNTAPTTASTAYSAPIQLGEGTTIIRTISVNKTGVSSLESQATYVIDIPAPDAPSVVPSTRQYDSPQEITISVPEGYQAYYTLDGTDPTIESNPYTGPIEMPEGDTLFCAVLVNGEGKMSDITTRHYELDIVE